MLKAMKGSGMWLSRRQMRWLVVLLALLPLVPAIMTMRLTLDNALRERDEAIEQETKIYRDQLIHLVNRTSSNAEAGEDGEILFAHLRRIFGDDATLILRGPGREKVWAWGTEPTQDAIVAEIREGRYAGWTVVLDRIVNLPEYISEQMYFAWMRAAAWAVGVALVAAVVWFAVHRGLRVDELRSDLLTTVSHEMKTPLASMRVLLETLTDDDDGLVLTTEAKRREYLDLVSGEVRRLTRLADDFLAFGRLERGDIQLRKETCQLREVVDRAITGLAPSIKSAGGRVVVEIDELSVLGDGEAISTVVRNLIENALKYGKSSDGISRILVAAGGGEEGNDVRLSVSDSGPGIAAEYRRAVFRQYFRVDGRLAGSGSGVGLGLSICRHLVRRMGGHILLKENPGGGCRFVVLLPGAETTRQTNDEAEALRALPAISLVKP